MARDGMMDRRTFIQGAVASAALVLPMCRVHASHKAILQFRFCMMATELICVVAG